MHARYFSMVMPRRFEMPVNEVPPPPPFTAISQTSRNCIDLDLICINFASVCTYMRIYAHICAYMLIYAHICAYVLMNAHICVYMLI